MYHHVDHGQPDNEHEAACDAADERDYAAVHFAPTSPANLCGAAMFDGMKQTHLRTFVTCEACIEIVIDRFPCCLAATFGEHRENVVAGKCSPQRIRAAVREYNAFPSWPSELNDATAKFGTTNA